MSTQPRILYPLHAKRSFDGQPFDPRAIFLRTVDLGAASVALILLSPIFIAVALMIRLSEPGPVLFRQKRVGRNGRPFSILKFRTMRINRGGPAITAAGDNRITPIGARLRKYKIDELPQFLNVLRGEMSLIGPRPEVPEYVERDDHVWKTVLQQRPGITDLASLAFRNEEEILAGAGDREAFYRAFVLPEKLRLNLRYQRARTLSRDFTLLWLTARYSFFPRGFDRHQVETALCLDRSDC